MMIFDGNINTLPFKTNGYIFKKLLGRGNFASVFKVEQELTGHIFAAKAIHCDPDNQDIFDYIQRETDCLMSLLHPNVINIYDHFKKGQFLFMILELCENGSISKIIKKGIKLSENQMLIMMKQLLNAISYCHDKGVAHRDIKPANILLSDKNVLKLGDFGLSIKLKRNEKFNHFDGSLMFKAPELISKKEHDPFKADIWSLGVTFFILTTGNFPWGTVRNIIEKNILLGKYKFPSRTPESVVRIISAMLIVNPDERATAHELLLDPCFSSIKRFQNNADERFASLKNVPLRCQVKSLTMLQINRGSPLSKNAFRVLSMSRSRLKSNTLEKENSKLSE